MQQRPRPFHYEDIPARGPSSRFRVGDANDDFVQDFPTEKEAQEFVRTTNAKAVQDAPSSWKF